jgi:integrase
MPRPRSKATAALPKYMDVRHGKRTTTYYALLKGARINLGHDRAAAERRLRELIDGKPTAGTIADMCAQFIAHHRALIAAGTGELAEITLDDYENSLNKHVLPRCGSWKPSQFKPTHKAQYLKKQKELARAVRGNREMAALGSAFNFGVSMGMIDKNPCHGVKRNKEKPRTRRVETWEVNRLSQVAKAKGESAYMIMLIGMMVAITGRRRAEVRELPDLALREEGIRVKAAKQQMDDPDQWFLIAWSPLLRQLVTEALAMKRNGRGYVFATEEGRPYTDSGFKTMWGRTMDDYVAQGGVRFTAHDLRAYYVTEMSEKGEDPKTHRNRATTERVYNRNRVHKVKPLA